MGFWGVLLPFLSLWIGYCLGRSFCPFSPPSFYFYRSFSYYAHGPAGCHFYHVSPLDLLPLFLGFLGFVFTSYCAHGPIGCHSCHVGPLGLLPLFLSFLNPFTSSLPLIVPMSLLVANPAMLAHWVYYLSSWASPTYLLYLYLLLRSWTCWLSFLPHWPIEFITLLLPLRLFFPPIFLIVGLLLPLGFLSKMGINTLYISCLFNHISCVHLILKDK